MFRYLIATLAGLAAFSSTTGPVLSCEALEAGASGRVASVTDGDTVILADGTTVRMVGIQAPKLPLGRDGFAAWPKADEAKAALEAMALGQEVTLHYGGQRVDRHGRALAHVMVADGPWAQQALLEMGLARVYSFLDNRSCLAELYAAERQARADRRGIWSDPFYAIRQAHDHEAVLEWVDSYELVEGRVLNAARAGGRVYLNFGRYWKEDFTVVIETAGQRVFEAMDIDPLALEDSVIRVRGWIEELDGPRVIVTHPEQIEMVSAR